MPGRGGQFIPTNQLKAMQEQMPPPVYVQQYPPNKLHPVENVIHLVLTVFTFGVWGIVWAIRARQVRDR